MITSIETIRAAGNLATQYKVPDSHVLALIDVESAGKIMATVNGKQEPYILFEYHKLYARLPEALRAEAVALGIASKKWNKKLYPKTQAGRWEHVQLARAFLSKNDLDPGIAYECTSWGVGQVLGEHWDELGFSSVDQFVEHCRSGVEGQADVMIRYCVVNSLLDELQDGRWAALARGYNGKSYAKNAYDKKLAEAALL